MSETQVQNQEQQEQKVVIHLETIVGGETQHFTVDGEMFNTLATNAVLSAMLNRQAPKLSPQWRKDQLVKTAVKALFIAQGDAILTSMFGTKEHPKPGPHDDVLEWYMRTFVGVAVWNLTQQGTVVLQGVRNEQSNIEVVAIYPRPVTPETGDNTNLETGLS